MHLFATSFVLSRLKQAGIKDWASYGKRRKMKGALVTVR